MTTPAFLRYETLTKNAFDRLDRSRAVVFATCSPIEVHGPHLPMGADALESEGLADRTLKAMPERHRSRPFVKMPPLYVGSDTLPQPGSLHFRPATVTALIEDLGRSLAYSGFRDLVIMSFHGSPRHFLAIEEGCARVNKRVKGMRMVSAFSLLLARLSGGTGDLEDVFKDVEGLPEGALVDDAHAGFVETSQLLALHNEWVEQPHDGLPAKTLPLRREAKNGLKGLLTAMRAASAHFAQETYLGSPAPASAALGERLLDVLGKKAADALAEVLDGTLAPRDCHSPLWKRKGVFLSEALIPLANALVGYRPPRT